MAIYSQFTYCFMNRKRVRILAEPTHFFYTLFHMRKVCFCYLKLIANGICCGMLVQTIAHRTKMKKIEPYTIQSEMLTANSEHSKERVEHIQ